MTKDNQVNEVIDLISEMIIKYITDNKQDKIRRNVIQKKNKLHKFLRKISKYRNDDNNDIFRYKSRS